MKKAKKKAVVMLSGGLDSATVLAIAKEQGYATYALSFDYGQRHRSELDAAARVAKVGGAHEHRLIKLDLTGWGGSALTDYKIDVPITPTTGIPVTYVPARNTIFLSLALAWAETLGAIDIFAGMNAVDYSGYPDCRPEFVRAFETLANLATRAGVEGAHFTVHTPLMALDKANIIRLGISLGVDYRMTHSCYDPAPQGAACGRCDACVLRARGFQEAGVPDPTRYASP